MTYEIEQAGDAVRLTMTESHDRPLSDDILSGGRQGWPAILSSLKSLLETGQPLVVKMAPPRTDAGGAEGDGDHDAVACRTLGHARATGIDHASAAMRFAASRRQ